MANLNKVIYLSNEDYETLVSTGTVTIGTATLTYDANIVYVTPEQVATTSQDGLMSAADKAKLNNLPESIKTLKTNNTTAQTASSNEAIAGSGVINLHKVAKTGTYSDLIGTPTIPTVNDGTLTIQKNGTNVATFTANQSGNSTANISVPTVFSDLTSRGEAWLEWGGRSLSGSVTPVGMALSNEHSANKLAFINGNALTFEYSSDAGSTWTTYNNISTLGKSQFCTTSYTVPIGRSLSSEEYTTNSRTRITLTAQDGTNQYLYTNPKKMLINVSTSGGMQVLIEYRSGTNYQSSGSWSTFGTYIVSGWSGWNDIPLILSTLGGSTDQTSNNWQLRLTFAMTSKSTSSPTTAYALGIRLYGENSWGTPSTMARTGHLYDFDMSKNAIFPAGVSATSFTENGTLLANKYVARTTGSNKLYGRGGNNTESTWDISVNAYGIARYYANAEASGTSEGTGYLVSHTPVSDYQVSTKKYVDDTAATKSPKGIARLI